MIHQLKEPLGLGYEKILLEITQNQDQLRRSTPVLEIPQPSIIGAANEQGQHHLPADSDANITGAQPESQVSKEPENTSQPKPSASVRAQPLPQMSSEERQARLDGHIASPVTTSPRVLQVKQRLAAIDGEELPDFDSNALVAIPVQAGGLHPISDLWYIEREIDTPEQLRLHIAQLAREIASSVNAPGEIVDVEGGVGFSYRHPEQEQEVTATAQHTLMLLQSLSGSIAIALNMIQQQPELQADALAEFEFAAGLGQLLLGQPTTKDQQPNDSGRLSDGALVKLFRVVRLARRLIDLEIKSLTAPTSQTDS